MSGAQRCRGLLAWCAALLLSRGALAAPTPLHVDLDNRSSAILECHAIAGHWYGFDLGTIPAGARTELPLALDRATGTISIPNSLHQSVPIQWMYCGRTGDAWRTRAVLPLRRLAESVPAPAAIVCRDMAATLHCD